MLEKVLGSLIPCPRGQISLEMYPDPGIMSSNFAKNRIIYYVFHISPGGQLLKVDYGYPGLAGGRVSNNLDEKKVNPRAQTSDISTVISARHIS